MTLFRKASLLDLGKLSENTMSEQIGMEFTEIGEDYLKGRMPVDRRTVQPYGILHGGASAALAETLGSMAGALVLDPEKEYCVGMEINANHVRSVRSGYVYGKATPIHIGRKTHIWEIRIEDESGKLVCISRLTLAIISKKENSVR
ncbi:MAG TPA: hotdog fold thioesterase [Candidatus Kryptobacter bacterium]|nr:MAG: esterase [Ignavibacteriae bacterium 37-53-5]HQT91014.1 hotdog fold thioesterase [Candidatus Kryptobacter bacterium]